MSRAIETAVAYTHNTRIDYKTKISAEFKWHKLAAGTGEICLSIPSSVPQALKDKYTKGKTFFVLGEEIIEELNIGIGQGKNWSYWPSDAEGIVNTTTRSFQGSNTFNGFFKIKDVEEVSGTGEKLLKTNIDTTDFANGGDIESFKGIIALSSWKESDFHIKAIKDYMDGDFYGSGMISEKVKNYSYVIGGGKGRINQTTGLPHELVSPLKRFKKLPNAYHKQIKELIYEL